MNNISQKFKKQKPKSEQAKKKGKGYLLDIPSHQPNQGDISSHQPSQADMSSHQPSQGKGFFLIDKVFNLHIYHIFSYF